MTFGSSSTRLNSSAHGLSDPFANEVLRLFEAVHPLDQVPRAGYVLRGVPSPESVAAHSHYVALLVMLVCDAYPEDYDKGKALSMALNHDLAEALLMDIPMPTADRHLHEAKRRAEQAITQELLEGFDAPYAAWHEEMHKGESPEARLVLAADKVQMMVKIWMYEREGKGRLREFWSNPKNFNDYGIAPMGAVFDALCQAAGHSRPAQ